MILTRKRVKASLTGFDGPRVCCRQQLFHYVSKVHLGLKGSFHTFPSQKLLHGNLNVSLIPISLVERSVYYRNRIEQRKQTLFTRHPFRENLSRIRRQKRNREEKKHGLQETFDRRSEVPLPSKYGARTTSDVSQDEHERKGGGGEPADIITGSY